MSFFISSRDCFEVIAIDARNNVDNTLIITSGADGLFKRNLSSYISNSISDSYVGDNVIISKHLPNTLISEMIRPNISGFIDRDKYFKEYINELFKYINSYDGKLNVIISELAFMEAGIKLDSIYEALIQALDYIAIDKAIKLTLYIDSYRIARRDAYANGSLPDLSPSYDYERDKIKQKALDLGCSNEVSQKILDNVTINYLFGSYKNKYPNSANMKGIFKCYAGKNKYLYKLAFQIASPRAIERIKKTPIPREKIFRLFIALHMDFGALLEMLTLSGYSFDPNNELDSVILDYVAYLRENDYRAKGELELIKYMINCYNDIDFARKIIEELFNS